MVALLRVGVLVIMHAMDACLPALVLEASELVDVLALARNEAVAPGEGLRFVEQLSLRVRADRNLA